jgi:predicted small metal-binding protein
MAQEWFARCDCGWSAQAPRDELISKIREHARAAHGLEITKKDALDQARPVDRK